MKLPEQLSKEDLVQIVAVTQEVLWGDANAEGKFVFNPDKEWDVDMLDRIGQEMEKAGLRPDAITAMEPSQ